MKKHGIAILLFTSIFAYRLLKWTLKSFGGVTSDQVFFHFITSTLGAPASIGQKLAIEIGLKPLLVVAIFYGLLWLLRKSNFLVKCVQFAAIVGALVLLAGVVSRCYDMFSTKSVPASIQNKYQDTDWMDNFYTEPTVKTSPKLNLIWIYFESLEAKSVTPENFPIYKPSDLQTAFVSLDGTGWTFSGIMATQCGVPYLVNPTKNRGNALAGTACLTDLLKREGYSTHYIGGAPLYFSGKDRFFKTHGVESTIGKDELPAILNKPAPEGDNWGYKDDDVLALFDRSVRKSHASRRPFFHIALTLDSHGPLIYSPTCKEMGYEHTSEGVFSCGLRNVSKLIEGWERDSILDNTVVVVSGDHPVMRTYSFDWTDIFKKQNIERELVYFYIKHPNATGNPKLVDGESNHFDLYPTVFNAIGGELENNAAGLVRNLYREDSLSAQFSEDEFNFMLRQPSPLYDQRWSK